MSAKTFYIATRISLRKNIFRVACTGSKTGNLSLFGECGSVSCSYFYIIHTYPHRSNNYISFEDVLIPTFVPLKGANTNKNVTSGVGWSNPPPFF